MGLVAVLKCSDTKGRHMKRLFAAAVVAGGMLAGTVSTAGAATYTLIELAPLTGGTFSRAFDINNSGDVVGYR